MAPAAEFGSTLLAKDSVGQLEVLLHGNTNQEDAENFYRQLQGVLDKYFSSSAAKKKKAEEISIPTLPVVSLPGASGSKTTPPPVYLYETVCVGEAEENSS